MMLLLVWKADALKRSCNFSRVKSDELTDQQDMYFYKQIHRNISDIYIFQYQRIEIAGDIGIWTFLSHISSKCFDSGVVFV